MSKLLHHSSIIESPIAIAIPAHVYVTLHTCKPPTHSRPLLSRELCAIIARCCAKGDDERNGQNTHTQALVGRTLAETHTAGTDHHHRRWFYAILFCSVIVSSPAFPAPRMFPATHSAAHPVGGLLNGRLTHLAGRPVAAANRWAWQEPHSCIMHRRSRYYVMFTRCQTTRVAEYI